jgi:hypothetical protein
VILLSPSGIADAFIIDNGAPIEFLQFDGPESTIGPADAWFGS